MAYDRTLLPEPELSAFLAAHPEWRKDGVSIRRTYRFPTFKDAITFVNGVAAEADARDHHPDIDVRYREVTLALTTHDAKGLTFRDVELAKACDALLS